MKKRTKKKWAAAAVAAGLCIAQLLSSASVYALGAIDIQSSVFKSVIDEAKTTISPGVGQKTFTYVDKGDGNRVACYETDVDLSGKNASLVVGMPNDGTTFAMQSVRDQASAAIKNGKNVVAAVNGDFYNMATGEPNSLIIKDGVELHATNNSGGFFGIKKDGTAVIGDVATYNQIKDDLQEAMSSNTLLVQNGKIVGSSTDLEPRTAVGIRADGSVFFIVIDGRQSPYSEGITLTNLAKLMLDDGAVQAANLDGGGSSTFATKTPGDDSLTVKNSPSDNDERPVANSWFIVSNVQPDNQFASAYITQRDMTYTPGTTVNFTAKGVDKDGYSATLPANGLTWSLTDASYGSINAATGVFQSNGKTGQVGIQLSYNGTVADTAYIELELPDTFSSPQTSVIVQPGDTNSLGLTATYQGRTVHFSASDVTWTIPNNLGTVNGDNAFVAGSATGSGDVTIAFNHTNLSVTLHVQVGQDPVVVEDCEELTDDATAQSLWTSTPGKRGEKISVGASSYPDSPVRFGNHAARLDFDFTGAQSQTTLIAYAGPKTVTKSASGSPTSIGVWVYGTPETQGMCLWFGLVDGNGKNFGVYMPPEAGEPSIANLGQIYWEGWKYVSCPINTTLHPGPYTQQGGGYAAGIISLHSGMAGGGPMTKGSIYFDNFRFVYGTANDDLTAPVIDSVNVDGKTYNTSSVSITTAIHDVVEANESGINWDRNRIWVDGVEYTNVAGHYSYDKDGTFTLSGYKWADGVHHVRLSIQDNFGNETDKDAYFTVNTGNGTGVSLAPLGASAPLGGTYSLALNADDLSNVTGATATVNIGTGFPVTGVDFAASAAGSTYQYDASTGNVTLNLTNTGAAKGAGTLATIHVSVPAGTAQGTSISYGITGGTATYAAAQGDSFNGTFASTSGTVPVSAGLTVSVGQMVVGANGQISVTTADGKPATGADVSFTPAGGSAEDLGVTDANGNLSNAAPTQQAQKFTLSAQLGAAYSFQTAGQSFNPQKSAAPANLLAGSTQDPTTEKTFTWMTNPLQGNDQAIMQVAKQDDYTKNGDSAFTNYTGTRQLITYSADSSAIKLSSVTATGLTPGTTYAYRVGDGANWSDVRSFTTLTPDDSNLTFNVFGDTQVTDASGLNDYSQFLTDIETAATKSDFAIHVGDFTDDQTIFNEMDITANMLSAHSIFDSIDTIHVMGNHELQGDDGTKSAAILGMPNTNGPACDKAGTYSVDYGNMHIAVLGWTDSVDVMNQKLDWLRQDMKATQKTWKIIALHQPAFNKNPADSATLIYDTLPQVCDELGVDLVFNGHDHSYGRTYPIYNKTPVTTNPTNCNNGTVYIATGHTGDKTYDIDPVYPNAFVTYQQEANKDDKVYLTCTVNNNKMHIAVKDSENGLTTDDVTLTAHQADKTALQSAITGAQALHDAAVAGNHEGNYPQSAIGALQTALDAANAVNSDVNATPEGVAAAVTALNTATAAFQSAVVTVNRTQLNALAASAAKLDTTKYTPDSWKPFGAALSAAQTLLAGHPSQSEIDDAFTALLTAENGLVFAADKSALQQLVDASKNTDTSDDKPARVQALTDALTAAQKVLDDPDATQADADSAFTTLLQALTNLQEIADRTDLNALIATVQAFDGGKYTKASWQALQTALTAAQAATANLDNDASDIQTAYNNLSAAATALVPIANKASLNNSIALASQILADADSYAPATLSGLSDLVAQAKAVQTQDDATQDAVNSTDSALIGALAKVRVKANKTELTTLVNTASNLTLAQYTAASAEKLWQALTAAEAALADENVTQDAVNTLTANLQSAVNGLVLTATGYATASSAASSASGTTSAASSAASSSGSNAASPKTGAAQAAALPAAAAGLAGVCGIVIVLFRRRKRGNR